MQKPVHARRAHLHFRRPKHAFYDILSQPVPLLSRKDSALPGKAAPPPRYFRFMIPHRPPTMEYTSSDTIRDTLYRTEP